MKIRNILLALVLGIPGLQAVPYTYARTVCGGPENVSTAPGVGATSSAANCQATALADYGLLRILASGVSGGAGAEFQVDFALSDPTLPVNTTITVPVPVAYDFILASGNGFASFEMKSQNVGLQLTPFYRWAESLGYGYCPGNNDPTCSGFYAGVAVIAMNFVVNSPNLQSLHLLVSASSTSAPSFTNAYNTVTIDPILLSDTMQFTYGDGVTGNPLNFQYASAGSEVPEPAMFAPVGIALFWLARRRVRS